MKTNEFDKILAELWSNYSTSPSILFLEVIPGAGFLSKTCRWLYKITGQRLKFLIMLGWEPKPPSYTESNIKVR